ncbi:hypothetical protein THOD04_40260 [Vibrio owensii]|nr:hypothetical protein THOD04_40260 [Vibrio owensii]
MGLKNTNIKNVHVDSFLRIFLQYVIRMKHLSKNVEGFSNVKLSPYFLRMT